MYYSSEGVAAAIFTKALCACYSSMFSFISACLKLLRHVDAEVMNIIIACNCT